MSRSAAVLQIIASCVIILPPMRICLIVNPNAGAGRGLEVSERVVSRLESSGAAVERFVSEHAGGTREIAETTQPEGWDGVVVVGGDGSLFEVINGLLSRGPQLAVPVGQIPVGTGNSFIKDLHTDREGDEVDDAIDRIVRGATRRVDLGRFSCGAGDYWFINLLGAGFVSNVAHRAVRFKRLGALSYILGVLGEVITLTSTGITLTIDGQRISRDGVFVEICNSRYTGGNMMMAPEASITDGMLDVIVLNPVGRLRLLRLLPTIFSGTHVNAPEVEVFRGREIRLESEFPLRLTPDGETFGTTPIDVTIRPGQLEMFV